MDAAVHVEQRLPGLRLQTVRLDPPGELDGLLDLREIGAAVRADSEMGLEAAPLPPRQPAFEVVGDELDRLLAGEVARRQPHHASPAIFCSSAPRTRARPRR